MYYVITHKEFDEKYAHAKPCRILHVGLSTSGGHGYLYDTEGDSIAEKNPNYCELTGLYWIWKNGKESPGEPVGIEHYRRYFYESPMDFLTEERVEAILSQNDIILPMPIELPETVEEHYIAHHREKDLRTLRALLVQRFPAYVSAFDEVMAQKTLRPYNMMICRKSVFDAYCAWLFGVIFELEKRIDLSEIEDPYQKRVFGFLAERLLNVWVLSERKKVFECRVFPVGFERPKNTLLVADEMLSFLSREEKKDVLFLSPGEPLPPEEARYRAIVCFGTVEGEKDPAAYLFALRSHLRENGRLLLFADNRLGLRYFSGELDPHTGRFGDGLDSYIHYPPKGGRAYAPDELKAFVAQAGFTECKTYSVFPSAEHPRFVISEAYRPAEKMSNRYFPEYQSPETVFLEEEYIVDSLFRNGMIPAMANGLILEVADCAFERRVNEIILSSDRKNESAMQTTLLANGKVVKRPLAPEGFFRPFLLCENEAELEKRGIRTVRGRVEYDDYIPTYVTDYIEAPLGNSYLQKLFFEDREAFISAMDRFRDTILAASDFLPGEGHIQKNAFPDMMPLNCFVIDGEYVFFDQEYRFEAYPADSVVTRMILIVYELDVKMEQLLPRSFFFDRYGLSPYLEGHLTVARQFTDGFTDPDYKDAGARRDYLTVLANKNRMNYSESLFEEIAYNPVAGLEKKVLYLYGIGERTYKFIEMYQRDYTVRAVVLPREQITEPSFAGYPVLPVESLSALDPAGYRVAVCTPEPPSIRPYLLGLGVRDMALYFSEKVYPGRQACAIPRETGEEKKPYHIGYIAGVFDLYHLGHLNMFKKAKALCDYLIVGVVTDEGVRDFKKTEPFIPFAERIEMVRGCRFVDEAVEIPYLNRGTIEAFEKYHFDVQFSGSDYEKNPLWLSHKKWLEERGATMVFFPYTEGVSSTKLKQLIDSRLI